MNSENGILETDIRNPNVPFSAFDTNGSHSQVYPPPSAIYTSLRAAVTTPIQTSITTGTDITIQSWGGLLGDIRGGIVVVGSLITLCIQIQFRLGQVAIEIKRY
jgi:hypothetical protein